MPAGGGKKNNGCETQASARERRRGVRGTEAPTFVPRLPVLPSPPNVGHGQDSAQVADEDESGDAVARSDGDVEPSVAVEEAGVGAIQFDALLVDDEHGDLSSVLGGIEDLGKMEKNKRKQTITTGSGYLRAGVPTLLQLCELLLK